MKVMTRPTHHDLSRILLLLALALAPVTNVLADDRISVDAKINDRLIKLAIDTGADSLFLFQGSMVRLGVKTTPPPAGLSLKPGELAAGLTEPVKFELFGSVSRDFRLKVLDHPPSMPPDVDGAIGWKNIRKNLWILRGASRQLHFLKKIPAETAGWIKLREVKERNILTLELTQNGIEAPLRLGIDTGLDSGVRLAPAAWARWRNEHARAPVTLEAFYMPVAGLVVAEQAWADELNLGGLVLRGVSVTCMNATEEIVWGSNTHASLGLEAVSRVDTVLDGKNGVAYMKPLQTPAAIPAHNRLGAVFAPVDPDTGDDLVGYVAAHSPAEKAGIKAGDVLLKIDELDVTGWRTQPGVLPLSRFFSRAAGTRLLLTLRRGNETLVCSAVLQDILGPQALSR